MDRPDFTYDKDGHWEPRPDRWSRPASGHYRCRATTPGFGHKACGAPAAADMDRGRMDYRSNVSVRRESWWGYCALHLSTMFRWVEGDQVMKWTFVKPSGGEQQ